MARLLLTSEPGGTVTKSLQLDGQFWLPDDPDTKVTGIVTFSSSEGAALSLIGSFIDIMDKVERRPSPDYRRIVGETVRGNLTLDDCHLTFEDPFQGRQRFVVSRLLTNFAYDRDEAVEVDWLKVRLSDFFLWLADGVPRMVPDWTALADAEGDILMTALSAKKVENIQLDNNAQLSLVHAISATFDIGFTSLRQNAKAQFKFHTLVDLDSALDHAVASDRRARSDLECIQRSADTSGSPPESRAPGSSLIISGLSQ